MKYEPSINRIVSKAESINGKWIPKIKVKKKNVKRIKQKNNMSSKLRQAYAIHRQLDQDLERLIY